MFQSASSPAATADSSALLLTPANNAAADVITPPAGKAQLGSINQMVVLID